MNELVGHKSQRQALKRLCFSGKLPTTMLFAGSSGIGKAQVAKELGRTLLCEGYRPADFTDATAYGGCRQCKSCRLLDLGNHPDFHQHDCSKKESSAIEGVRQLLSTLELRPFSGTYRVVLFDRIEQLSLQTANVLLKSLEEPRPQTYFVLISSNPYKLPRTVLSRCQILYFNELSKQELKQIIEVDPNFSDVKAAKLERLLELADGSMENAVALKESVDSYQEITEQLDTIFGGDVHGALQFARSLGSEKELISEKLRLMRIHVRAQMLAAKERSVSLKWSVCLSNLVAAQRLIFERNLNASYVLSVLLLNLVNDSVLDSHLLENSDGALLENIVV